MINKGDSPGDAVNIFIGPDGKQYNGILIAVSPDGTEGIMEGTTGELCGRRVFVKEIQLNHYPGYIRDVSAIPYGFKSV